MESLEDVIHELEVIKRRLNKVSGKQCRYPSYEASVCVSKIQRIINAIYKGSTK